MPCYRIEATVTTHLVVTVNADNEVDATRQAFDPRMTVTLMDSARRSTADACPCGCDRFDGFGATIARRVVLCPETPPVDVPETTPVPDATATVLETTSERS